MPGSLHPLVRRWVDSLCAFDLEALVECYDAGAVVKAFQEEARGRQEIGDQLTAFRRYLRDVRVDEVGVMVASDGHFRFETQVRGRLGHARIRHDWVMAGDRIADHAMQIVGRSLRAS